MIWRRRQKLALMSAPMPMLFYELQEWKVAGLIDFRNADSLDEVVAKVLGTIREHITNPRAHEYP